MPLDNPMCAEIHSLKNGGIIIYGIIYWVTTISSSSQVLFWLKGNGKGIANCF
jgi:hypothetical protein